MNDHPGAIRTRIIIIVWRDRGCRPAVDPFGGLGGHIHTAMAAWVTIIVVPVSSMKRNPISGEITDPGHAG